MINVPFPDTPNLVVSNPSTIDEASIDLPLIWEANDNPDSPMDVAIVVKDSSNYRRVAYCFAAEDGYFELPAATVATVHVIVQSLSIQ